MIVAVVPAYNEEKTIGEVIRRLKNLNYEIVVVDDGSKDKTYEIAKKFGAIVLKHEKNRGKGAALRSGLEYVINNFKDVKYVIFIDADLQHIPEESQKLIQKLEEGYDIVKGYRSWKNVPFRHKFGNYFWNLLFFLFFGKYIRDLGNGFLAMRIETAKIIKDILEGGYIVEAKILKECFKRNLKIAWINVTINYQKKSRIIRGIKIVLSVAWWILKEGLKYAIYKI